MPTAEAPAKVWTISELNARVHDLLESNFPEVWVEGEISNFRPYPSGHSYFTLKDAQSQVSAVLFKGDAGSLKFSPKDGLKVLARARVSSYVKRGDLQLVVSRMEPRDVGALQLALEQLKEKLKKEGLFEADRKRPIPRYPKTIGIVTSLQGAAVRDMLTVIGRRWPLQVLIYPVRVQGEGAAAEIAQAIEDFGRHAPETDVLLVGRGGGSIEDLWAFNEEPVARAIAASPIPVISCVGHETDFTVADFVADVRAPTPSAAAELAVPQREAVLARIEESGQSMRSTLLARLQRLEERLARARSHPLLESPRRLYEQLARKVDELSARVPEAARRALERCQRSLELRLGKLDALSPLKVLSRGYSIAERTRDRRILHRASDAKPGEELRLRLHHGRLICEVKHEETSEA